MFFTEITVDEMQQWQTTNKPFQLIDVRSAEEIKQAAIPDALGIPLTTLPMRHQEIDKDRPIICYCHSGTFCTGVYVFTATRVYKFV